MTDYIKREDLLDLYKGFDTPEYEKLSVPCPVVYQNVLDIPAADVREVVRGEWITKTRHEHYPSGKPYEEDFCSICGKRGSLEFDYCPNCGADMRGKK